MRINEVIIENRYRIFLMILGVIVLYILLLRTSQLIIPTVNSKEYIILPIFFTYKNLILAKTFLFILIILLITYAIHKETITPILTSLIIGYAFQLIIIYLSYPFSTPINQVLYKLSLEMILLTTSFSILDNIKPYLKHRRMIKEEERERYKYIIPDLLLYIIILVSFIWIILYLTDVFYDFSKALTVYAPKEFNTLLKSYIETNLGYLTMITISFTLITYFIYNIIEPLLIYLSHSYGQARNILYEEYKKIMVREKRFLYDVNRQLYIGIILLLPVLIFPIVIFIYENPLQAYNYFIHILYDFSTFNYTVSRTSTDNLLQIFVNAKVIEVCKEKLEELIRFFLYLLY